MDQKLFLEIQHKVDRLDGAQPNPYFVDFSNVGISNIFLSASASM